MTAVELTAHGARVVLEVDPDDHIGRVITSDLCWYERPLLEDAYRRRRAGGLAIDVGAHVGNHTLWFSRVCRMRVVALEPYPPSYQRLLANVAAAPGAGDIRVVPWAAGRESGQGRIVEPVAGNSGTAGVVFGTGPVKVISLDSMAFGRVDLLKIDVEGSAVDVLLGAAGMLRRWGPVVYAEGGRRELLRVLPRGYRCFGEFAHTPTFGFAR